MKLDTVAEMYADFTSLTPEGQEKVLEKVKNEYPILYPAFKRIADRQREGGREWETITSPPPPR